MTILRTLFAAALAVAVAFPAESEPSKAGPFQTLTLVSHGRRQEMSFYDFTGDGIGDALMVSVDFDVDPPVRWFALHVGAREPRFQEKPTQIWAVSEFACAFMVANVVPEGGVDICLVAPDGLYYYAFDKAAGRMMEEPKKLLHLRTFFTTPSPKSLPGWSGEVDLDQNGLPDLILPVPDGYRVYFQTTPGVFGKISRLESDFEATKRMVAPRRFAVDWELSIARGLPPTSAYFHLYDELPRIATVDLTNDGLLDLVNIQGNVLTAFVQKKPADGKGGDFPAAERKQSRLNTLQEKDKRDTLNVSDLQFCDLDGDGNTDLIVTQIYGELGLLNSIKTRIFTHIGQGKGRFNPGPDGVIDIDGISLNPQLIDMNGDGLLDCLTSRLRTDILKTGADALIFQDVTVTYEVFQGSKDKGVFESNPAYDHDVRLRVTDIQKKGAAQKPNFFVPGDVTGDKLPDAIWYDPKTATIEVHPGRRLERPGGKKGINFDSTAHASYTIDAELPPEKRHDPRWLSFFDIDGDGRTDVLLNYGGMMTILFSRF